MKKHILLALTASMILAAAGCSDDSSKTEDTPKTCDESNKPSAECTCNQSTGLWENCGGSAKDCKAEDKTSDNCTCNQSTGLWENCGGGETCLCDDGITPCPGGNKTNCMAAPACTGAQPDAACICDKDTGKWDCSAKCTGAKPEADCICSEDGGSWGWKCPSNCTTEQPAVNCICQDSGSWLCECNTNTLKERQTCDCNDATGEWIDSTCTFSCPSAPENAKTGTCQCNDKTGELEGCQYNCQDTELPHNAKSCTCDESNGSWQPETCKYNCPEKPANATSCDCDDSTGELTNCTYTCPVEPDNVVSGSCSCDQTTGEWVNCEFIECNNSDKPTEHVQSCECVEGAWDCIYNCLGAKPDGYVEGTCVCPSNGQWSCEIDKCQGETETLLVGQVCDKATGNITYNKTPQLKISADKTTISEDGTEIAQVTVKLAEAQPDSPVTISYTYSNTSLDKINVTPPTNPTLTKDNWDTGLVYQVTGVNNDAIDGTVTSTIAFTTSGNDPFNNLQGTARITVTDDDKPSIILSCAGTDLYPLPGSVDFNAPDDRTSLKCNVRLAMKPSGNVTVTITSELVKSDTCGSSTSNCSCVTPYFGKSDPDAHKSGTKSMSFDFTKDNYSTPEVFYVVVKKTSNTALSNAPEIYNIVVQSSSTDYVAEQKLPINAHIMQRYMLFGFHNAPQKAYLPKGRYRLHAVGASGGLGYSSDNSDYKFMDVSCNTSTGKASFKYKNHGGAGAYIYGELNLTSSEYIYVYTGEAGKVCGSSNGNKPYNGGGLGRAGGKDRRGVSGGGATDFCINDPDCEIYEKHWPYRIMVAGGGGGGSDWSEDGSTPNTDTTYKHGTGGSAKWVSYKKGTTSVDITGGNGLHYGEEKDGEVDYYAPAGYTFVSSYIFGKGFDAEYRCSDTDSRRNGGGGGGWYGGTFHKCAKDTGGGAGSSYAYDGDYKHDGGDGRQVFYKLTNIGGEDGGTTCNVFNYIGNGWGREIISGQMLGVGNGYAFIEVLDD